MPSSSTNLPWEKRKRYVRCYPKSCQWEKNHKNAKKSNVKMSNCPIWQKKRASEALYCFWFVLIKSSEARLKDQGITKGFTNFFSNSIIVAWKKNYIKFFKTLLLFSSLLMISLTLILNLTSPMPMTRNLRNGPFAFIFT